MLVWYVIQVINGREDAMRERIERVVPRGAMQELFYPQYQTEIKVHGEWIKTTKPLFPGYLICDTADPRTVQLLPLCLTGDKPELALTIQREDGFYAARTCLTLDMAYNNARLICRPETSWIKR